MDSYIVELLEEKKRWGFKYYNCLWKRHMDRNHWYGKFIALANNTVNDYENWLEQLWRIKETEQKGIEEWNQWNVTLDI